MRSRYPACEVRDCPKKPITFSRFCPKHAHRYYTSGHPEALALRDIDLARHRRAIAQALADLSTSPAVRAAYKEAALALEFRAGPLASKYERQWEAAMRRLRAARTTPGEFLQRVCEVLAIEADHFFPDLRSVQFALAREVVKLQPLNGERPSAQMLARGGELLHGTFALFAARLLPAAEVNRAEAQRRREAMESGWETT